MNTQLEIWQPLVGGGLIGVAVSALLLLSGRIAGVSGVVGNLLGKTDPGDRIWRLMFALGLFVGGAITVFIMPSRMSLDGVPSYGAVISAGLLVGFGTRLGNGCTSGHGVCGISRFSIRSLVATVTFIAAGMVAVLVA